MTQPSIEYIEWTRLNGAGGVFETSVDGAPIKIGRMASAHLRLDEPSVSRIHAVVEPAPQGGLQIVDLASSAGTIVNGQRVQRHVLCDGDEVLIGDVLLRVALRRERPAVMFVEEPTQLLEQAPEEPAPAIEPYTLQGYYDERGNYIPGYYDEHGQYHLGYGYHDDLGRWEVALGYYDPQGNWIEASSCTPEDGVDLYTAHCFGASSGETLEIAMLWGDHVLSVTQYPEPRTVRVGVEEQSDFVVEHDALTAASFPLVLRGQDEYFLALTPRMGGFVQHYGQTWTIEQVLEREDLRASTQAPGAQLVPLSQKTSARVELGDVAFLVSFTDREEVVGGLGGLDRKPLGFIAASAALHLLFLFMALTIPSFPEDLELDQAAAEDRFVQLALVPEQVEEQPDPLTEEGAGDGEPGASEAAGEEGAAGREDSPQTNNRMAVAGDEDARQLQGEREYDRAVAMNSGAVSVLGEGSPDPFGAAAMGADATNAIGALHGAEVGDNHGVGGLGVTGPDSGGGGDSVKIDLNGTRPCKGARCGGSGVGGGDDAPGPRFEPKDERVPAKIIPGPVETRDCMTRESIARVARQRRAELRACYERQLQRNRRLAGTIKVNFKINASGAVFLSRVVSSTMNNREVEACVERKIRHWHFPPPQKCAMVNVNYPFNFRR